MLAEQWIIKSKSEFLGNSGFLDKDVAFLIAFVFFCFQICKNLITCPVHEIKNTHNLLISKCFGLEHSFWVQNTSFEYQKHYSSHLELFQTWNLYVRFKRGDFESKAQPILNF